MNLRNLLTLTIIVFLWGCNEPYSTDNKQQNQVIIKKPVIFYYNIDSVFKVAPDTFASPEIKISQLPNYQNFNVFYSVTPGKSMLKQSVEEIKEGKPAKKSSLPIKTKIDKRHYRENKLGTPEITVLMKPQITSINQLSDFKASAIKAGTFKIKNGDTIIPPSKVYSLKPELIKALSPEHKDEIVMDISYLDFGQNLPNSYIRDIVKDKNGVFWFISHTGGLISYDGNTFGQYIVENGLSNDLLLGGCVDSKNRIWIASQESGINMFDGETITHYTKDQGLPSNIIFDIIEDSKGDIWASYYGGIIKIHNDTIFKYGKKQNVNIKRPFCLFEDRSGDMWVASREKGVGKISNGRITYYDTLCGLPSNMIFTIFQDSKNNMWFGTIGKGVSMFDGDTITTYTEDQGLGSNYIMTIGESDNTIWFGTYGNGVTRFDGESFNNISYHEGMNDNYYRSMFINEDGRIFFGSDGGGVSIINPKGFKNITKDAGLIDNTIIGIFEDKDRNLLLGNFGNGVFIFDNKDQSGKLEQFIWLTKNTGLTNDIIVSIDQHPNGDYLFGTFENGFSRLDKNEMLKGKAKFTNYHTDQGLGSLVVRAVHADSTGKIWLGTEAGISIIYDNKVVSYSTDNGFPANNVLSIFEDKDDNLWFGTMNDGVIKLKNNLITIYKTENGLANNTVWSVTQDFLGNIWFGTDGGGVSCLANDTIISYNTNNGLCYNYVFSLVPTNNSIWAGTTRGLSQILIEQDTSNTGYSCKFINYGKEDGLKGVDFYTNSGYYDSYGRLWLGTDKALIELDINDHSMRVQKPKIKLDNITINNINYNFNKPLKKDKIPKGIKYQEIEAYTNIPKNLTLKHNFNHLTFDFSSVSNLPSFDTKYQFRLFGLDNDWSPLIKEREADYRNLSPGNYVFQIKAKDKFGNWSDQYNYKFKILWPWWQKWWAFLIYSIIAIVLVNFLIKYRVRVLQKQKAALENMIFDRTRELDNARMEAEKATEAKSKFIATISHELRTPLNAIVGLIHLASNNKPDLKQKKYLSQMDKSARTLLGLINDILDFSKIEAGKLNIDHIPFDFEVLVNSVAILNANNAFRKNLEFIINTQKGIPTKLIGDPLRISQIITNLCSNAIKFTESGEVVVNFTYIHKSEKEIILTIVVKDTGIGITDDQKPLLFNVFEQGDNSITRKYGGTGLGLAISKQLIDMMNGQIWFKSEGVGKGAEFGIELTLEVNNQVKQPVIIVPDEITTFNILICITNSSIRKTVSTILDGYDIKFEVCTNINEGIKLIKDKEFELVIFDNDHNNKETIQNIISESKYQRFILLDKNTEVAEKTGKKVINIAKPVLEHDLIYAILNLFGMNESLYNDTSLVNINEIRSIIGNKKVLIAEDSEINQQVMIELLENVGVYTDVVASGNDVIKNENLDQYDLILMDLHMAGMDGYTATKMVRKMGLTIPVIIVTADAFSIESEDFKDCLYDDFITKPVDPDILYKKIVKAITGNNLNSITNKNHGNEILNPLKASLDINQAVKRFAGNTELYITILKKFAKDNKDIGNTISELIKKNKANEVISVVHKLKGESGNIGATGIFDLCVDIRKTIEEKDFDKADIYAKKLSEKVSLTIAHINEVFKEEVKVNQNLNLIEILNKLKSSLKDNSPAVFDLLDKLENSQHNDLTKEISLFIKSGKNDEAIEKIQRLISSIKK